MSDDLKAEQNGILEAKTAEEIIETFKIGIMPLLVDISLHDNSDAGRKLLIEVLVTSESVSKYYANR